MTFEEMQSRWNSIRVQPRSHAEIMAMTDRSNHPRLRKMRERLWVECGFFVVLGTAAIVLAGVFSGPMWLALSFVITNALHLFKAFTAEYYQRVLPSGPDLIQTQASYSRRMKNLAAFSRFAKLTPVIAVLLILVFRDGVGSDYLIPLALAPTALALTGWWVFREPNVLPKPNF